MSEEELGRPISGGVRCYVGGYTNILGQPPQGPDGFVKGGMGRPCSRVAVPPAVGPLRSQHGVHKRPHPRITGSPQTATDCHPESLLCGVLANPPVHGADRPNVLGAQEPSQHLLVGRPRRGMTRRDGQLDQGHQSPEGTRPLRVRVHPESAIPSLPSQEGSDTRAGRDRFPSFPNCPGPSRLSEDVGGERQESDRGIVR